MIRTTIFYDTDKDQIIDRVKKYIYLYDNKEIFTIDMKTVESIINLFCITVKHKEVN